MEVVLAAAFGAVAAGGFSIWRASIEKRHEQSRWLREDNKELKSRRHLAYESFLSGVESVKEVFAGQGDGSSYQLAAIAAEARASYSRLLLVAGPESVRHATALLPPATEDSTHWEAWLEAFAELRDAFAVSSQVEFGYQASAQPDSTPDDDGPRPRLRVAVEGLSVALAGAGLAATFILLASAWGPDDADVPDIAVRIESQRTAVVVALAACRSDADFPPDQLEEAESFLVGASIDSEFANYASALDKLKTAASILGPCSLGL